MRPAVFLDRDGTLIEQVPYLSDPAKARLLPGAAEAVRDLRKAGYACVLVTNQSALGRGMFGRDALDAVHAEVVRQLEAGGTELDGWYFCPVVPETKDRSRVEHPDRKPGPGMLERAAADLGLDLGRSWMVGDMVSDVLAGRHAGCRGSILVSTGLAGEQGDAARRAATRTVRDLSEAARVILASDGAHPGLADTQEVA
ncbi:MAG: D-glycero-alpha-D-manno-heptose-1,7-bisphosphate 7-phosphatase [Phycisphaeraceae bacterium]